MAFYENFLQQCLKKGVSAYQACMDLNLSHSALGKWKNGSNPRNSTLLEMASFSAIAKNKGKPLHLLRNPWYL